MKLKLQGRKTPPDCLENEKAAPYFFGTAIYAKR